jgi:hypothetical protein
MLKKKILANFQGIIELFTKKMVKKLLKIWSWDPGSEIRDPGSGKTYSGSRIQGSKRHRILVPGFRIRIRNTSFSLWNGAFFYSNRTSVDGYSLLGSKK